jgi:hypothetical protein
VEGIYYFTNSQKVDKNECNNYRGITLLSTAYKLLSNILLVRLTPYVNEIIGDHQRGFHRNRSTPDQIFYIRQILEKKWEYNGTVNQLFIDFKKACDSIKREVFYNFLLEFGIPKKAAKLIKICLNKTYSKVPISKILFDTCPVQNGLKEEMLFAFAFKFCFRICHQESPRK